MHVTAKFVKLLLVVALVALSSACGEFTREGRAPVVVVVDHLAPAAEEDQGTMLSDVLTKGSTFNDLAEVEMRLISKDPGVPGIASNPSLLNAVTITRYRVEYRRTDGRSTQGVDVPYAFDSAATFTIPNDGTGGTIFQIVRHSAKEEAPLKALSSNLDIISTIAYVTFYGRDQAGNDVSVTATMGIDFADFADPS
jgi:hypothetical protein